MGISLRPPSLSESVLSPCLIIPRLVKRQGACFTVSFAFSHTAMFALSVRSLDGTCRPVDLLPDSSVADLRAHLEQKLSVPPMHEIKLTQDLQELMTILMRLLASEWLSFEN